MTLLDEFTNAATELAIDFGLTPKDIVIKHFDTPKMGIDYSAELYKKGKGFSFYIRTVTEEEDSTKGRMTATLSLAFKEEIPPYYFDENIDYLKWHPEFLSRWVAWAMFNFRQAHERVDLFSLFQDCTIRIYGIPNYSLPAEQECEILFKGIIAVQTNKLFIYKFRHIRDGDRYRGFSYAIRVDADRSPPYWVFFANQSGLDSGGAGGTYYVFEDMINLAKKSLKVKITKIDVEYEQLERFLLERKSGFDSILRGDDLHDLFRFADPSNVLEECDAEYEKFQQRLNAKEYPQALRELRALVQQAEENVARMKSVDLSKIGELNVNSLAAALIKAKVIDGKLSPWFQAFSSVSNIAAHRNFPTRTELENWTLRRRVLLTLYLGRQLLEELENALDNQ
jgi:hypothetical protein